MRRATLLVALLLLVAPPMAAQEWSADQQEVVEWLEAFNDEAYVGGVDEFMAWLHPEFTAWNYANKTPLDLESFTEEVTEFFGVFDSVRLGTRPLSVQVFDDVAVLHTWYREALTGPEGETFYAGRWTIVLKKLDGDWRHLSWTWTQEERKPEKERKEEEG